MIERNEFDKAIEDLAIRNAPKQIAKVGDIVTTANAYWKRPHKVKITRVSVEIASIELTIKRREELGLTGWLMVQHQYIGRRLKANGEETGQKYVGRLLYDFTTEDGQKYERIPSGFNHIGLVFDI